MASGPTFRPVVVEARQELAEGREQLRAQHDAGSPGFQVCARLTDLLDSVLLRLFRAALEEDGDPELESLVTLAPHGGYGRRDMAPYSDVDLMMLAEPGVEARLRTFVRRFTQSIYDAGLDLGFSLRTTDQACSLAMQDATVFTSLVESRFLAGSVKRYTQFAKRFRRQTLRRSPALVAAIEQARNGEQRQYGETVYLLQPNVKRSRGALRDVQLVRWLGFARWGVTELDQLERSGVVPREDRRKLRNAHEFLLRLRNELHFHSGKAQDVLDKGEQLRIAARNGHLGDEVQLPVEQFMRTYFEHTSDVSYAVAHLLSTARQRGGWHHLAELMFSHRAEGGLRVGFRHIGATPQRIEQLCSNLDEIMRLMDLSNRYKNHIDYRTWQAIRERMIGGPRLDFSPAAVERFLSLLSEPGRLGSLLRRLHELRVLEKLVPPMAHARCLVQFNDYHKYTVDEHSIRAVECATGFLHDNGTLGDAYRSIRQKRTLHLALLMHDLGKGFPDDHSELGARLAEQTGRHLGLPDDEVETIKFLVLKHLVMSDLAQRRDIGDESIVVQFAVDVESAERLRMLYVLTCADLAAVGPGVLTTWKLDLVTQLYERALEQLAGEPHAGANRHADRRRKELQKLVTADDPWWADQIASLPDNYVAHSAPAELVDQLRQLKEMPRREALAWGRYLPERCAVEYTIGAYEDAHAGIFHRLTGALSSLGLKILSAEIHTLPDQVVLDRFYVEDLDFTMPPPDTRIADVTEALTRVLQESTDKPPTFRRLWSSATRSPDLDAVRLPSQVRIDNNTSERFTILDVFAHDRIGLLYTISRTIFELDLSVHLAKIGTHLDQVVDVFYVSDQYGRKVVDPRRLDEIRRRLLGAIQSLEPT